MDRRRLLKLAARGIVAAGLLAGAPARAETVTLRLHQFLPPVSNLPTNMIKPWAERVEAASGGTIAFQHFDAMALGGRPSDLMDQAADGVVDIAMTLTGYTPGRFPRSEVFELPFVMTDPVATSLAFWEMVESDFQASEFSEVKVLGAWVHGPGVIHTRTPVNRLEDMAGMNLRGPTAIVNDLLSELGANPIGMPLPSVPEALSKGVIDGTVVPWEVTPSIRLSELVQNHTEFSGDAALYTATFVMVMNRARYDTLPDAARAALDGESGAKLSGFAGQVQQAFDAPARAGAVANGDTIIVLDAPEVARWRAAAAPVIARWIAATNDKGIDAEALVARAQALIAEKSAR